MYVTVDRSLFHSRNLGRVLEDYKKDVSHWRKLPLSLLSRAALFKIIYLPKFLYMLQNTPCAVLERFFRQVDEGLAAALGWWHPKDSPTGTL